MHEEKCIFNVLSIPFDCQRKSLLRGGPAQLYHQLANLLNCLFNQSETGLRFGAWVFFGRNDAKAETPVLWPPHVKSRLTGKDSDAGKD